MVSAGIDIGSRSIELVLLEGGEIALSKRADTTFDPLGQCAKLLADVDYDLLVATGYGRKLLASTVEAKAITEIQAYALGARRVFPDCRSIIDIGGQDTKAIALRENGNVLKFEMNDRCAAGTGKFLEFMATSLQLPLAEFGEFARQGQDGIAINSMCTVFAESEATSLMARGNRPQDIALALHKSVLKRSLSMLNRVGFAEPLVFGGGVANNSCLVELLEQALDARVLIPNEPDSLGALGAALAGARDS